MSYYLETIEPRVAQLQKDALHYISQTSLYGYEAGVSVEHFFRLHTNHPHPSHTLKEMAEKRDMSKDNTREFAENLAERLAHFIAANELL